MSSSRSHKNAEAVSSDNQLAADTGVHHRLIRRLRPRIVGAVDPVAIAERIIEEGNIRRPSHRPPHPAELRRRLMTILMAVPDASRQEWWDRTLERVRAEFPDLEF